jgi:hypothetical protein
MMLWFYQFSFCCSGERASFRVDCSSRSDCVKHEVSFLVRATPKHRMDTQLGFGSLGVFERRLERVKTKLEAQPRAMTAVLVDGNHKNKGKAERAPWMAPAVGAGWAAGMGR